MDQTKEQRKKQPFDERQERVKHLYNTMQRSLQMKEEKERGKSVIYSTHYMEEAEFLCDRILMMLEGEIIAEGTPQELKNLTGTGNLRDCFMKLMKGRGENIADKENHFAV